MGKRIKIPKNQKKMKGVEEIEIGRQKELMKGSVPRYEIRAKVEGEKDPKLLGFVNITGPNEQGSYVISGDSPFGPRIVRFEDEGTLDDAKNSAYRTAFKIGRKIADTHNVLLEDRVSDEELAFEIDSLPYRNYRAFLFALTLIGGIAFSVYSLSATGYAVSNSISSNTGTLGLILFIVGLAGLFFSLKK